MEVFCCVIYDYFINENIRYFCSSSFFTWTHHHRTHISLITASTYSSIAATYDTTTWICMDKGIKKLLRARDIDYFVALKYTPLLF